MAIVKRRMILSLMMIVMLIVLAACGSTSNNTVNNNAADNGAQGAGQELNNQGNAEPESAEEEAAAQIVLKHAREDIVLDEPAKRVVVIEWTFAEDLLALGVQPVGSADIENYNKWVSIPVKFDASVTDIGTRVEPNLEIIQSLEPDLIITEAMRAGSNYEQLQAIAPTLLFDSYGEEGSKNHFDYMVNTFQTIAMAVGKEVEAEQVLKEMNVSFEQAAAKLKAAGKEGEQVVVTQAWSANNVPALRLFTDNSSTIQILERIGLKNAWQSETFEVNGFTQTTVEALTKVENATLLHMVQPTDNIFENQLKDNAVFNELNFVKENRIYALGGDSWPFGGPLSAQVFADKAANLLAP